MFKDKDNWKIMNRYRQAILIILLLFTAAVHAQDSRQYFTHIVKKGETLYSLSKMYGTTVDAIVKANPGSGKVISINQKLRIPQTTTLIPDGKAEKGIWAGDLFHTIKAKETLYSLSREYGISYMDICEANPGLTPESFIAGEVIVIPLSKVNKNAKAKEPVRVTDSEIKIVSRYEVRKGETIEDICKAHGVLKEDFVRVNPHLKSTEFKKKTTVNIPAKRSSDDKSRQDTALSNDEIFYKFGEYRDSTLRAKSYHDDGRTRVAVILPFMLNRYSPNEQARMVEFYEGMLMAVYRLKQEATVILAARGNRYVLSPEQKGLYVPIYMQEFPFFIGTLKTKVDYVINSPSVSRFHAKIEQENEQFFLVDLNSTNGTFVNGQRLEPNEKCMIYPGDLIAFAEIGYRFGKEQN